MLRARAVSRPWDGMERTLAMSLKAEDAGNLEADPSSSKLVPLLLCRTRHLSPPPQHPNAKPKLRFAPLGPRRGDGGVRIR